MDRDRTGRRRRPEQDRGLRPLHPVLPPEWLSRAVRIAMSVEDWARFDALVHEVGANAPTQARAQGEAISALMDGRVRYPAVPSNWMDWERQKALRLLRPAN